MIYVLAILIPLTILAAYIVWAAIGDDDDDGCW